jgi:hypothetical protein
VETRQREQGGHAYSAEDFGIDMAARRQALKFYTDRYRVPEDRKA